MSECDFVMLKTALNSEEDAMSIARRIVGGHYAVSVQIKRLYSIYEWKGNIDEEDEFELTCITTRDAYEPLARFIQENHPYELGEILCIPVIATTCEFGEWISNYVVEPVSE